MNIEELRRLLLKELEKKRTEREELLKELEEARLEVIRERAYTETRKASKKLEEARKKAEITRQKALRERAYTERELAWWDSVKDLPPRERVREICKHHHRWEGASPDLDSSPISLFPLGEA